VQWTRSAALRSPLTPAVRRACAAQASARTAPRLHRTSSRPTRLPEDSASRQSAHHVVRLHLPRLDHGICSSRHLAQRHGPIAGAASAARSRLTVHPALSPFRSSGRSVVTAQRRRSASLSEPREPHNAHLHTTDGLRRRPGSPAHPRSRPGPDPRSSALPGRPHPPRSHSGPPNPGVQRTRGAMRRSPLTPDVRRACAAPDLRTGSTSPRSNIRVAARSSPRVLSIASPGPHRGPPEPAHIWS